MAGNPRIDELRKKLDKEPGSRLFAQLAEELRKDGDLEEAIQVAREGLQKHSNYPSARMTLGRALFDTGDWSAARAEFDLVLKGAPDNILASRLLAECLESLGDVPAAIARYKKTLALAPGDKQVLARLESLEKAGGTGAAVTAGASAPSGSTGRPPEAAPAASPAPIRVVEVDTPMELEQAHERVTTFSSAAPASAPAAAEPAPSLQPPPSASPAPIPVSAADEEFELERPYEPPRPVEASAPPAPTVASPSPAPSRPAPEGMMEFEFEAGPTGSTIPFAPPPAPAPPVAEPEPTVPAPSAPPPPPEPIRAVEPPPPPAAPAAPPSAAFVPERETEPEPSPAARAIEVPWSAPPPKRVAPPPPPAPEPAPSPTAAAAPASEPLRESAAGELMSATLAELYFNQGFVEKAVEVYRQLVDREPDNDRLRRRLDELQHPRPAPAPAAAQPAPAVAPAAAASTGPDPASRRMALERTIARLEGMLAAIKKG